MNENYPVFMSIDSDWWMIFKSLRMAELITGIERGMINRRLESGKMCQWEGHEVLFDEPSDLHEEAKLIGRQYEWEGKKWWIVAYTYKRSCEYVYLQPYLGAAGMPLRLVFNKARLLEE